ncbi:MAG: TadE/TadG family type IV pilus assembly protein [Pyrinomonadaceae bacterium]
MLKQRNTKRAGQSGATLIEFTVVASTFFLMLVAIVAAGNLYYTHNALVEATRRGARYAVLNPSGSDAAVKNVVVYGTDTPAQGATSLIHNLTPDNVSVNYFSLNVASGTVTVTISNYSYPFVAPTLTTSVAMPPYRTTLTGEAAGFIPPDL